MNKSLQICCLLSALLVVIVVSKPHGRIIDDHQLYWFEPTANAKIPAASKLTPMQKYDFRNTIFTTDSSENKISTDPTVILPAQAKKKEKQSRQTQLDTQNQMEEFFCFLFLFFLFFLGVFVVYMIKLRRSYRAIRESVRRDHGLPIAESIDDIELVDVRPELKPNKVRAIPSLRTSRQRPVGNENFKKATDGSQSTQDFITLRKNCLENGQLFEDPEFLPIDSSLQFSRPMSLHVEWKRPREIADKPQFFVKGVSRFDVQQGGLGDCWLLAATASLTQNEEMFFRVVPDDQSFDEKNYAGIFHFKFWQYGRWIDVVIDDQLPTYDGKLLYMHSSATNEFWSALLEKAYAKLYGSYEALDGGAISKAMEDFTGGKSKTYYLDDAPPNLFDLLLEDFDQNSMMACSTEEDPNDCEATTHEGLIKGHAYTITKIYLMDISTPNQTRKIPMLRIRNPWGDDAEWNGPWSDKSPEWLSIPADEKIQIGLTFDYDGEFWMSFQDWMKYFDAVEICNLSPTSLTEDHEISRRKKRWAMSVFKGAWIQDSTAGGCRNNLETFWQNPQYFITLEQPDENDDDGLCTLLVELTQINRRTGRNMGMDCLTIGFAIYRVTERDMMNKPLRLNFFKYNASVARSPAFINLREVSGRFKLPPGHYVIVPSTFKPNKDGEFLIRVFLEPKNTMKRSSYPY